MRFLVTFVTMLFSVVVDAQTSFTGMVHDEKSEPIVGVVAYVGDEATLGTITSDDGTFVFRGLRIGQNTLHLRFVGYAPIDTTIDVVVGQSSKFLITMSPDPLTMRAAEIAALRSGDNSPFARSLITKHDLVNKNTGVDLPYLLELEPSVVVTSDAGTGIGYTGMRIRGTDATRTNITLNGVPFNDPESQGAFLVNLPDLASSAEDIVVQRGVGTSTNGPAAFGATVNLRTTSVKKDPWGTVGISGGSFNTQRYSVSAGTGLIKDHFSLDLRLSSITSDGYIDRATADLKSYFLQSAWVGKKRSIRFITFRGKEVTYQSWAGVSRDVIDTNRTFNEYAYKNEVDNYDQSHYQLIFEEKLGANSTFNLTGFRVDGKGCYENLKANEESPGYFPTPIIFESDTVATNDFIIRRWLDNTLLGLNASLTHRFGAHDLIVGGSYCDYRGAHFGEVIWARYMGAYNNGYRYYDDDARKSDGNVYAKLNVKAHHRIHLFGDLQVRSVNYEFLGFNEELNNAVQNSSFIFFNPKAGINWSVQKGARIYGSFAIANREPNRDDFKETTPSSRPTSERLVDYEAGYEWRSSRYAGGFNFYYMDYTDQLVLTGELNDVGAALRTNVPSSYRTGLEVTWVAQVNKWFRWKGNATFSKNRINNFIEYVDDWDTGDQIRIEYSETPIAFSPELIGASELGFRFWQRNGKGNAYVTLVTKYVGEQYLDNSGSADRRLDAYLVNDIRLNVTVLEQKNRPRVDINLTARNVLSELYASNGWSYSYLLSGDRQEMVGLYPQAPLNFMGGVTVSF